MSTLQANSTFLPVLDDLLSPDFRPVSIPGQTPQTPAETPLSASANKTITFAESHTGQLTTKSTSYGGPGIMKDSMTESQINGFKNPEQLHRSSNSVRHNPNHAAMKIQLWWKHRKGKVRMENGTVDIKAERAKHSIRHHRTEEHVRHLETEVHRLKSALATERKLRSLQLEAIRSLWSQVQKVSTISSSPSSMGFGDVMSQSMPNGLPIVNMNKTKESSSAMSMSLHSALDGRQQSQNSDQLDGALSKSQTICSCTKEIQSLRESFTSEMGQLRMLIDQLKTEGSGITKTTIPSDLNAEKLLSNENVSTTLEESKVSQQKRPLTLNLTGHPNSNISHSKEDSHNEALHQQESESVPNEGKSKELAGYATKMASNILDDAKEKDDEDEDTNTQNQTS